MSTENKYLSVEVVALRELLGPGNNYVIPGFQRPYEWEKEQLEKALSSVHEAFDQYKSKKDNRPCIFGTLQLNNTVDEENSIESTDIIDGQQRLTTFYLLLRALGCSVVWFEPVNYINSKYEEELKSIGTGAYSGKYGENFDQIKSIVEKWNIENLAELAEYILDNVIFIRVVTKEKELDNIIKIFDTLNTTGLDLDTKDLFKIKYCEAIKKSETDYDRGKVFERINDVYSRILDLDLGKAYSLNEDDLLYAFKFWIIGHEEASGHSRIKMSNLAFFNDLFDKGEIPEAASFSHFHYLGLVMEETQKRICEWDKKTFEVNKDFNRKLRLCAKELLEWSGYGVFRNLLYVYVLALVEKNGNEITDECIENALELTEWTWKLCSAFHARVEEVINDVYYFVINDILKIVLEEGAYSCKRAFIRDRVIKYYGGYQEKDKTHWRMIDFIEKLNSQILKNVFTNSRKHFFVALSYIDDYKGNNILELKESIFYREKWDIDIEHIISQDFCNEDSDIKNSIGNLLYLEKAINRSFGKNTSKSKRIVEDMGRKLKSITSGKEKSYRTSKMDSVTSFLNEYINNRVDLNAADEDTFINIVRKRQIRKAEAIRKIYIEL